MSFLPQREQEELLDLGRGGAREVERSLHDIARINRTLGGSRLVINGCLQLMEKRHLQRATILDLGTGLADIPRQLIAAGHARGWEIQVVGLDNNRRHLQIAQRENTRHQSVPLLCGADALELPFADKSVDIVMSSLFVHHFRPAQIVSLLNECSRVARVGWLMNDIVRHILPLWFFRTTWPIFARSYLTRHDGTVSLRRGYTVAEMRRVVEDLPDVQVRAQFPFRMKISREF